MTFNSILIRKTDNKEFKVFTLDHWSAIKSNDGEVDTVKWLGADMYISQNKGHLYFLDM